QASPQPSTGHAQRLSAPGAAPGSAPLGPAYSETPPPVSYGAASVAPPPVGQPGSSYPPAAAAGLVTADASQASYVSRAGFVGPHGSVPPPALGVGPSQAPPALQPVAGSKA